mmetsp:Transcript_11873/g.19418  ORF Transcript_11873/g.19418 Transcript_11873/m.19418 type:complete len:402 (+) Transcript_11873:56-1261(+)
MDANNHLDDEIQSRRQDELEALQAFYGHQLRSSLPADFSPPHHHRGGDNNDHDSHQEVSLNGPWFIELLDSSTDSITSRANNYCKIPTLEIRLPPHYPLSPPPQSCQNSPTPILHHIDHLNLLSSTQKQELIEELMDMYEPEMDMAILWAERCRQEFLDVVDLATLMSSANEATEIAVAEVSNDATSTGQTAENNSHQHEKQPTKTISYPSIRFLTFNHLLYGKSHKKESQIVSLASKLGHIGFIVYGTPGIIGLLVMMSSDNGDDNEDVIDFAKECSTRVGKRATVLDYEIKFDHDGGLLPSSFEVEGRRTCGDDGGKMKKNKKSKNSKGGNNNKGNNSSTTTGESSAPLLVNLLGADRVTTRNGSVSIANMKSGLRHFDSLAELKEVLPGEVVPNILGL